MTCILWSENRLYADCQMIKGEETFQSLTKINKLETPLRFVAAKRNIDDVIHGWVCTGASRCAAGFVQAMPRFQDHDTLLLGYEMFEVLNLITYGNTFEIILIGEKANHSIMMEPGNFRYKQYVSGNAFCMGSGGEYAMAALKTGADPLRAMYRAFLQDDNSGGMIDCWELRKREDGTLSFDHMGMSNALTNDQIPHLLLDMKEVLQLDFIPTPKMDNLLTLKDYVEKNLVKMTITAPKGPVVKTRLKKTAVKPKPQRKGVKHK